MFLGRLPGVEIRLPTRTENGEVADDIKAFEASLRREQRWICGLTMQAAATLKRINVVVWEWKQNQWCRTGLVLCDHSEEQSLKRKTVALVLDAGHYYVLKTASVPQEWLSTQAVLWCNRATKEKQQAGYFARVQ